MLDFEIRRGFLNLTPDCDKSSQSTGNLAFLIAKCDEKVFVQVMPHPPFRGMGSLYCKFAQK